LSDNIISYVEMCQPEGVSVQQGMNFGISGNHSVILMSVRRNTPYRDRLEDGGTTVGARDRSPLFHFHVPEFWKGGSLA
jgi:hypothetical protein